MANTLTAFQELMEHGEDLWDQIVTHRFIKNVRVAAFISCFLKLRSLFSLELSQRVRNYGTLFVKFCT